jgi:hypothetical protein
MVRRDPIKIFETPNYIKKTITIRPDKDNQIFTFKQVKDYVSKKMQDLPDGSLYNVTALNILRNSTLKMYAEDFMSEDKYEEYTRGKVEDNEKFDKFYEFTVTIREERILPPPKKLKSKK